MLDVLITDLTVMGEGGNFCIAGWDFQNARMVRPLPAGHHWAPSLVDSSGLEPGVTIRVRPAGTSSREFPHRTEDLVIDPSHVDVIHKGFHDWAGATGPGVSRSISNAFSGNVRSNNEYRGVLQGVHIAPETRCPSLAAINIARDQISLFADNYGALKAEINDGDSVYCVKVTARCLRDAYSSGGVTAATAALPSRDFVHVRLGLAHPYIRPNSIDPPKCYMMLNGAL